MTSSNQWMAAVIFLFTVSLAIAQESTLPNLDSLDAYFTKMVEDWDVPSMSIGIVKDGELVFAKGYGSKEVGIDAAPDANTLYAIASNSKAFTASILATLVQEGKIEWDDKVTDYVPYFALEDPYVTQMVTIRDLLSHRVGLGTFSGDVIWYKSSLKDEDIIKRMKHLPLTYDFRSGWGYSNLMFLTAGEVIETVTGKSWSQNVSERFLSPLEMDRSITNIVNLDEKGNYATPHSFDEEGNNIPIEWVDWSEIAAMGGIISSVNDMAKWMIFNLDHGSNGTDTILTRSSINQLWKPHNNFTVDHVGSNPFERHFNGYGLGWGLSDFHGRLRVGHTGGFDGMLSAVTLVPDDKLGVVVLTNGMKSPMMAATYYALDQFLGTGDSDWSERILKLTDERAKNDTRIPDRIAKRVMDTKPSLEMEAYTGTYNSKIYGDIEVSMNDNGELRLDFEHSPEYSCTLDHWHYDVWKIRWDTEQAWFRFGTVKFNMDNNLNITGMDFDVPNDDIFFEELKPVRK